jgi:hypothetical protein
VGLAERTGERAIVTTGPVPALLDAITARERQREALTGAFSELAAYAARAKRPCRLPKHV